MRDIDDMVVQYDVYGVALNREAKFNFNKTQEQLWLEEEIAAEKTLGLAKPTSRVNGGGK